MTTALNIPSSENSGGENEAQRMADRTNKNVFFRKRKGGPLTSDQVNEISYKNPELLRKFTSEGGRILAARITGLSMKIQRKITREIKIARMIGLLPFVAKFD
jgi:small subunit ribosomal protein S18